MQGYWRDEKATAEVLDEKGYHTGDLGYQDSDGYFYVSGRKDEIIKAGGHRINPMEIEDLIMGTGLVSEVSVHGVEDRLLGHRLVALAASRGEKIDENDILKNCAGLLPKYKIPKEIHLVKDIPKTSSGKVDRQACLQFIESKKAERFKKSQDSR